MRKRILLNVLMVVASMSVIVLILGDKIYSLRDSNGRLRIDLYKAKAAAAAAEARAAQLAARDDEQQKLEHAELIKLRGEVASLRKEKQAWDQKASRDSQAAAALTARGNTPEALSAQNYPDYLNRFLKGSAAFKGSELGNVRRKMLNHEQLTEEEQMALSVSMSHTAQIEKSPADFSSFQTAFIGSVLGWNKNDPRATQLQELISRASTVANERGYDFGQPLQNSANWNEQQKMLNNRVTGAVQTMLTPEERTIFDSAFIGVLGVDNGILPAPAN